MFKDGDDSSNLVSLAVGILSNQTPAPPTPRRANPLPPASSLDDPARLTSNLSTKDRYERDIANIDDYENEERRRRQERQTQAKMSDIAAQSKKATGRKKSAENTAIESTFDGSEYISTVKTVGKRSRGNENEKSKVQQPKQPKRERSLTSQIDEVKHFSSISFSLLHFQIPSNESNRQLSPPMLSADIQVANTIEDLFKIFDKYILPTEFALGLQKLCQLASVENSDAVHVYSQLDNTRNRMESLLVGFVSQSLEKGFASSMDEFF